MKLTPEARRALDALPPKRRAFVLAYCGEAAGVGSEAARRAGYKSPEVEACRLLRDAKVALAVKAMRAPAESRAIASVEELREWWSAVMRGEVTEAGVDDDGFATLTTVTMKDRLKASELLGKSQAAFVENRNVNVTGGGMVLHVTPETAREVIARTEEER